MYIERTNLKISKLFVILFILSMSFSGCLYEKQDEQNSIVSNAIITISMNETFSTNCSIYILVNITNEGSQNINGCGFCYTFLLTYPNGFEKELFCPFNNSMGIIKKEHYFEQTIDLKDFSNDTDTWKVIGNLSVGNYEIYAIYRSDNNPWEDSLNFPYDRAISNVENFKIV